VRDVVTALEEGGHLTSKHKPTVSVSDMGVEPLEERRGPAEHVGGRSAVV
jgi:hypothetical protein